jgi:hypothetical protein
MIPKIFSNSGGNEYLKNIEIQPLKDATFLENSIYITTFADFENENTSFSQKHIDHFKNDLTTKLIIRHDWSPIYPDGYTEKLFNIVDKFNFDSSRIYFIMKDKFQIAEFINELKVRNLQNINIEAREHLLIDLTPDYATSEDNVHIQKKFSVFCRSHRLWRFEFFKQLIDKNLLNDCIYSYINIDPYENYPQGTIIEKDFLKENIGESYINRDSISNWIDGMPYQLTTDLHDFSNPNISYKIKQTYFHIVLESSIDDKMIFLTEKTWKSVAAKRPFIIFGKNGILELLKQLGYKTFSPWINESYDQIENPDERMQFILNEMERLHSLSDNELLTIYNNCKLAVEHNYQLYLSNRIHVWSEKFKALGIFN